MPDEESSPPSRVGSYADLARRIERVEARHESLEGQVRSLASTVERVELNQKHGETLNTLRFDALDTGVKSIGSQLTEFTKHVEGILNGEVVTPAGRQGQELVQDYQRWRESVETRLQPGGQTLLTALESRDRDIAEAKVVAEAAAAEGARNRLWIASVGGAVSVVLILVNLFAPAIRHVIGLQ